MPPARPIPHLVRIDASRSWFYVRRCAEEAPTTIATSEGRPAEWLGVVKGAPAKPRL
jgi:hypothetical protein